MSKAAELHLKISGNWTNGNECRSEYPSVQKFLNHYARKNKSEHTRTNIIDALDRFLLFVILGQYPSKEILEKYGEKIAAEYLSPDLYVKGKKRAIEEDVQSFLDAMNAKGLSIKRINSTLYYLMTFFQVNGWKNGRTLEVQRYHEPPRYRKRTEYVPTVEEAWAIIENAGSLKHRTALGCVAFGGLRHSTVRALLHRDVMEELENPELQAIKLPVYREMKKLVPDACKNNIPYYSFCILTDMMRAYESEVRRMYGDFPPEAPFFVGERSASGGFVPMSHKALERAAKGGARITGKSGKFKGLEKNWYDVTVKSLRVVFENILKSAFADGNGRMSEKDAEFLMGHILPGTQDPYYDSSKVEDLRAEYLKLNFREKVEKLTPEAKAKLESFDEVMARRDAELAQLRDQLKDLSRVIEEIKTERVRELEERS